MMALSTLLRADSGCTMSPPSTATHTLCTLILPVFLLSETSTAPAPSKPERSVMETPTALPFGRFAL
jgi:hypothetical protein